MMPILLLLAFTFQVYYVAASSSELEKLKDIIEELDTDYKDGNMTKLSSDFQRALTQFSGEQGLVHDFLKKMKSSGEIDGMVKLEKEWSEYTVAHKKHYDEKESRLRMAVFASNELLVEKINKEYDEGLVTYKAALNDMSDLTEHEIGLMSGLLKSNITITRRLDATMFTYDPKAKLPKSVDWRKKKIISPVRDQGLCGSCYAFASLGALEAHTKKWKGKRVSLSPQNIIDCTWGYGNAGCQFGFVAMVFQYAKDKGVNPEEKYPYITKARTTCLWNAKDVVATDKGFYWLRDGDEAALKYAVAKYGPVVVAMSGYQRSFQHYKEGVYSATDCGDSDHAVLVVGYGKDKKHGKYWIIKNSWGKNWGMDGYAYVARDKGNMCHVASKGRFPIM